jgi:hypothetical protein
LVVAVVLGILILGDLNRRMSNARRLERDALQLSTEVVELEARNEDLMTRVAGATGQAMIEDWARAQGRLVREGEHLVVPVPADPGSVEPSQDPEPFGEPPTNIEVWWALLFGG